MGIVMRSEIRYKERRELRFRIFLIGMLLCAASLLFSCGDDQVKPTIDDPETTITQHSINHTMVYSGNGYKRYRMFAKEIQRYELATEPFTLYPSGIKVETFKDSTANVVDSDLIADWAHYNEAKQLWEARGNVVANNYSGSRRLETQQLFWDEKTGKIYTDKDATIFDGKDRFDGKGFETDQSFDSWRFNRSYGRMIIEQNDSTKVDSTAKNEVQTNAESDKNRKNVSDTVKNVVETVP